MNDTQFNAQLRTLYNLIYDSAFLIQELDWDSFAAGTEPTLPGEVSEAD